MSRILFGLLVGFAALSAQADVTGSYTGDFEGRGGILTIANNGGYTMTFAGADGSNDILGAGCSSVIGAVDKVSEKKGTVKYIRFDFSPGNCFGVWGKEITVSFKDNIASVELYSHSEDNGEMCLPDPNGRTHCNRMQRHIYLTGKFIRQ